MTEDQWIPSLNYAKSYSRKSNLKILNTTIFITVFMNQSGKITLEEMKVGSPVNNQQICQS